MEQIEAIPLTKIEELLWLRPRLRWEADQDPDLDRLAKSLGGPEGQIHPIVVVPLPEATVDGRTFGLVAGHRRVAAARLLGWDRILARILPPCRLEDPKVKARLLAMAIRENTERLELDPGDRAEALRRLKAYYEEAYPLQRPGAQNGKGLPPQRTSRFTAWASEETHLKPRVIERDLRLALLGGRALEALRAGILSPSAAEELARVTPERQEQLLQALEGQPLTRQAVRAAIQASRKAVFREGPSPLRWALKQATPLVQQAAEALAQVAARAPDLTARAQVPEAEWAAFQRSLNTLAAQVAAVKASCTLQVEGRLEALGLVLQETLPLVTSTLRALNTHQEEGAGLHPSLAQGIQENLQAVWEAWQGLRPVLERQSRLSRGVRRSGPDSSPARNQAGPPDHRWKGGCEPCTSAGSAVG